MALPTVLLCITPRNAFSERLCRGQHFRPANWSAVSETANQLLLKLCRTFLNCIQPFQSNVVVGHATIQFDELNLDAQSGAASARQ
jgi:hypothetical protein